jgi:hypothetical protein
VDREHGEIPTAEMQKRGYLLGANKAKEYGYILAVIGGDPLTEDVVSSARIIVRRSFQKYATENPAIKDWAFVVGPDKPVWRYEDCINSPDEGETCSKGEDCSYCEGTGRVPVEIIEGQREYQFGWYSIALNP